MFWGGVQVFYENNKFISYSHNYGCVKKPILVQTVKYLILKPHLFRFCKYLIQLIYVCLTLPMCMMASFCGLRNIFFPKKLEYSYYSFKLHRDRQTYRQTDRQTDREEFISKWTPATIMNLYDCTCRHNAYNLQNSFKRNILWSDY